MVRLVALQKGRENGTDLGDAEVAQGAFVTLHVSGSSGAGKTYTLEGGHKESGIVSMAFATLCEAGKITVKLEEVRQNRVIEQLGSEATFKEIAHAVAWYQDACARRQQTPRLKPTTAGEAPSSRSWTRLTIVSFPLRESRADQSDVEPGSF